MNKLVVTLNLKPTGLSGLIESTDSVCDRHLAMINPIAITGLTQDACIHCTMEWDDRWRHLISTNTWLGQIDMGDVVYISGPMSFDPVEHNHTAFALMEHALKMRGANVLNPCHHDDSEKPYQWLLKTAFQKLLTADKAVMLWNWQISNGATKEHLLAQWIQMPVYYEAPLLQSNIVDGKPVLREE